MKETQNDDVLLNFETIKIFLIGFIAGAVIITIMACNYINHNYIKIYDVDIGHFCFKDGHIYQLEQLVDEKMMNQDFKKSK